MKPLVLICLGLIGILIFFFVSGKQSNKINKIGLSKANLIFSGIVTDVDEVQGYNGYGIIKMKIISSNIKEYDPRDSIEFYYCLIKHGRAEVYGHAFTNMIGDTLNIDTQKRLMSIGSKGNESDEGSISINPDKNYYQYIRNKSEFKK